MSKPIVAIVGRPNVGKSTLFNIFADSRISIVKIRLVSRGTGFMPKQNGSTAAS